MKKFDYSSIVSTLICLIIAGCQPKGDLVDTSLIKKIRISGAMRNVMMKGDLQSTLYLDTISARNGLYGIGPADSLSGEIMIINGQSFVSQVSGESGMRIDETFRVGAPFFVYAQVMDWQEIVLPDSVTTMAQLESYINFVSEGINEPLPFTVTGFVDQAFVHVVNMPKGTIITSPEDAHQGEVKFKIENTGVEIVGFFSRKHKGVFTHHDSNMHMHLITKDRSMMGHLDDIAFKGKVSIYLPLQSSSICTSSTMGDCSMIAMETCF